MGVRTALQKLSQNHDQDMRERARAVTDVWLAPKSLKVVTAGLEAGAGHTEEVKKRGRGHGLGAPSARGRAAGNIDRVLWLVQGQGLLFDRGSASNPAQGQGDGDVQRAGRDQERGREPECWTKGPRYGICVEPSSKR